MATLTPDDLAPDSNLVFHGDAVRVSGTKRDDLQSAIALVKKAVTDFPLQYQNFRD